MHHKAKKGTYTAQHLVTEFFFIGVTSHLWSGWWQQGEPWVVVVEEAALC